MKQPQDTFPQEITEAVISHLKSLHRKGIKSVYINTPDVGPQDEPEVPEVAKGVEELSIETVAEQLSIVEEKVRACTDCGLHETRTNTVFGKGTPSTKVVFIGEAPGRDEDLKGEPFVGRSGQLLTKIIQAMDLNREDVYITNILKCRPPENREPQESEVRCCEKYLISQIELIKPKIICALGRVAAQWLLDTKASLASLRNSDNVYHGTPVLVTYHPAALLRNPQLKREAWDDFKQLKTFLAGD
jgi:DNA polymerase